MSDVDVVTRTKPIIGTPRSGARSGAIGLAGAAVNGACGFALTTVIVRGLGAGGSGALFSAIALISILGAVCCLGADTALIWALPRRREGQGSAVALLPAALLPTVAVAVLVAVAGAIGADAIAGVLFDGGGADGVLLIRLAFLGVPVVVASTVLLAAVRATRPVGAYVGVQFVGVPVARPVLIGGAVLLGCGAGSACAAAAGGAPVITLVGWLLPVVVAAVVAAVLLVRPLRPAPGTRWFPGAADWRTLWVFALPRAVSVAIDAGSMWIGVLLTAALAGAAQAGVFAAVGRYALAGLLVMQGLRVAVAPRLSRLLGTGRHADAAAVYRRAAMATVLLSWPAYLLLAAFAPAFLQLFGSSFRAGAAPLAVLAVAMLVNVGVGLVQTLLLMSGNSRQHLYAAAGGLALTVLVSLVLVPRHGALGAAIAWSLGIVAENVAAAVLARRVIGQPLLTANLVQVMISAATATGAAATVGVLVAGRDLPGLAVALGVLAAGCGVLLADARVRVVVRVALRAVR